ncbi:tetraspanin-13a [Neoarius graeffei]|uniref:tetraspanin-13a n=1 Tax=Neoarius graeffei TaxID=443677 RepID=UPI00298C16A7|nr:tetraspanin-13a [Neoarius graeffei]
MACGGFVCSRYTLCALNILYMLVSLLLITGAAWGKWVDLVTSFNVVAAVIAVGVFLFFVAVLGLCGAMKHHQVLLFFYMFILFIVFIVQFSVSCASLVINKKQQELLLEIGWNESDALRTDLERSLDCCDFSVVSYSGTCKAKCVGGQTCEPCSVKIQEYADDVLHFVGGTSLFFSFTEILGVWLTYRYRNLKDTRLNPHAFL